MAKVFGVQQAFNEYDLLLIGLACLLQLAGQIDDVIPAGQGYIDRKTTIPTRNLAATATVLRCL